MRTTTYFNPGRHHIYLRVDVHTGHGLPWTIDALLDTGAPWTEVSDTFLHHAGLLSAPHDVDLEPGLETKKYGKLVLPEMRICGHTLTSFEIRVSRFEESWGVDALVGLDFFRLFPVTIDYQRAVIEAG